MILRIKSKRIIQWFGVFLFLTVINGGFNESKGLERPINVFVSIEPQVTFVERIGAERVTVEAMVLPGESPATYSPKPAQMARLAKSKLFFRIGVPFEDPLMERIKTVSKHVKIVDTRKGIVLRKMEPHGESHGDGNDGYDPHIWLNPLLVQQQAVTIRDALISIDPDGREVYESNCNVLVADLEALHKTIKQALGPVKGETIYVFHPSYGYFTDAYGLKQVAVETAGKAPKGKNLSQFIKRAKKENVHVVFVQPQFDRSTAEKIAQAIHGAVVPLDPLSRDYFKNMEAMADTIRSALQN